MDEIAWLFNSDFEKQLFSTKKKSINSSKQNQEFEYLISYLEPEKVIFTQKKYTNKFSKYFEEFTGETFKYTGTATKILPWCSDYNDESHLLKYQSKVEFYKYMKDNNFHDHESSFVNSLEDIESGYLYKDPYNVSGMGHLTFPKNQKTIESNINQNITMIKEKPLNRIKDFSSLIFENKRVSIYENIIDRNFFYTGSIFENKPLLEESLLKSYDLFFEKLILDFKAYKGVMSIDSFLYLQDSEVHLFKACEVNMRKTMGYIAYEIKQNYFSSAEFYCFRLFFKKISELTSYELIDNHFKGKVRILSPLTNRFQVIVFNCQNRAEYIELEKELLLKFF